MYTDRLRVLESLVDHDGSENRQPMRTDVEVESLPSDTSVSLDSKCPIISPNYQFAGLGIGFASMLAEVVLSHPFVVFRSQCQVRSNSRMLHLLPFSLIPVIAKCTRLQGPSVFWKGLGGVFIVRGLYFLTENVLSEITSLPKEVSHLSTFRRISTHILLRTLSWIIVTPFYAASVIELVQSDKASEPTTLISSIRDGFCRLFHLPTTPRSIPKASRFRGGLGTKRILPVHTSRMLPIWRLVPSVVLLHVGHYIIRSAACVMASAYWGLEEDSLERDSNHESTLKTDHRNRRPAPPDWLTLAHQRQETALQWVYSRYYNDLVCSMIANMIADVIVYPLETLVFRLCVQGTRTLVDDMDTGTIVVPVVSAYDGFVDAFRSASESPIGLLSLYRGFGALIAQYAVQIAFLYGVRYLYQQILCMWSPDQDSSTSSRTREPFDLPSAHDHSS